MIPIADGHCDYLYGAVQYGYDMRQRKRDQAIALDDMQKGGVAIQFLACWIDTTLHTPYLHQCIAMIDAYERMLADNPELVKLTPDFEPGKGRIATVLAVEGGEAIEGSKAVLRTLKRLGVRAMTLTWNENNELSGAAMGHGDKGLTTLGKEIIDLLCELNIAIDVSHLSDRGVDNILDRATKPIFASHSNARAIRDVPRALSDEHIRRIAQQGGTIGVNFYFEQLSARPIACIDDIVRHICHIAEVGGVDCCAIGSDFDGMQTYPRDLKTSRDFPALLDALVHAGFSEADVKKIAYQNLHRYILPFVR